MSLSTYADLKNAVLSFAHRANIQDAVSADIIPDLITLGEKWIFRKGRCREMETALNVTINSTTGLATVPTDYMELKYAYIDGAPTRFLYQRPVGWIFQNYPQRSSDTKPTYIAVDSGSFHFGPFPDSGYTVKGSYWGQLTSIATSVNAVYTAHPDLYLYAAICAAEPYLKNDKRLAMWMAIRDQTLEDINEEADSGEYGAGGMNVAPG